MKQRVTFASESQALDFYHELSRSYIDGTRSYEGDFGIEVEEVEAVVRVSFAGNSYAYSYRDPSGELRPGDLVLVPFFGAGTDRLGTVVDLGRGTWTGPLKDVRARVITEELA